MNASEKQLVETALGSSCQVHSATIVRLYKSTGSSWRKELTGAAAIITDLQAGSNFLKLIDLESRRVSFSQELYNNFEYQKAREFFHTFELDTCVAGFSFADQAEAQVFYDKVRSCSAPAAAASSSSTPFRQSVSPPATAVTPSPPSSSGAAANGMKRKKSGKGFMKQLFGKKEDLEDELVISEPTNFRHASSIGWDPENGFKINNIPPEWRRLFQSAGIKKSDLKNKNTADFVVSVIEQNGGFGSGATGGGGGGTPTATAPTPPPLPPSAPPPPPGAPAPPPPGAPTPPPPSSGGGGGSGGERTGLLSQIREGASLRHVDESAPSSGASDAGPPSGLADTLARAMAERRINIREDAVEEEDEDWSDEDWEV